MVALEVLVTAVQAATGRGRPEAAGHEDTMRLVVGRSQSGFSVDV